MEKLLRESRIIPLIFLVSGLVLLAYPMLGGLLPGDLADTRFIHYILEHSRLWLHQTELHTSLWNMPFYYDYQNTLAFSDMMLGAMGLYIPLREFFNPHTALKIWFLLVCILNYISMYYLLKKCFKFNALSSAVGAFLFAFSLPRSSQIEHFQLFTQFFMIISLCTFFSIDKNKSRKINNLFFFLTSLFFTVQLYTCFYFGWFMVYGGIIFLITALIFKETREKVFDFFRNFYPEIVIYSSFTIILLLPLIEHYLAVGAQFPYNMPDFRVLKLKYLISSKSIIDSIIYSVPEVHGANMMGIGFITTIAVLTGLFGNKTYRKFLLLFSVVVLAFFMYEELNRLLFYYFPGANVIRAGSRVIFLLLPIYSYCLAYFLDKIKINAVLIIITVLILAEQITPLYYNWSAEEHNKRINSYTVPENCRVIYKDVSGAESFDEAIYMNVDMMWLGIKEKVYTVNGYSGYMPRKKPELAKEECRI